MYEDGKRAIDTFLGKDSAAYEPVMKGETYVGEANILGEAYYTEGHLNKQWIQKMPPIR